MKKQIGILIAILFAVITLMFSCAFEPFTHTFSEEWSSDETGHWHAVICLCENVEVEKFEHTFGEWEVTQTATKETAGSKKRVCSVCGYEATEVIEKLGHTHTFAEEWSNDKTDHWKECTCGEKTDFAEHTFGEWKITKEATEDSEGSRERNCTVCGEKATEVIAELSHTHKYSEEWTSDETNHWHASTCGHEVTEGKEEHTFGDWTITKEATEEEEGSKERICTVCGEKATEAIEKLPHTHKFAEEWSKDETYHWHAATCGHEDEEVKEEHTFGDWIITKEATKDVEGSKYRICAVCNEEEVVDFAKIPKDFVLVEGTTITGSESWTPTSNVFVKDRSITIPNLYVSDHEVTRAEYKEVLGSDPSIAKAYDKNGTELTGDNLLNNPVNNVSWYDALVYCNKLSINGNLTPCYSINGSTNPEEWGEVPTSSDSTWNKATCDFEADGYRLPTEAEWEWLARGEEDYDYAGSNNKDEVAWYKDITSGTREVKTKAPNGYGLYDMSGNVREWCWDWYVDIEDSTGEYGAASGSSRVMRGGSWDVSKTYCQVNNRTSFGPYLSYDDFGFRVVRTLD